MAAAVGAWLLATVVFFVAGFEDAVVGLLIPVAVAGRVDFTIVVPEEAVDELVLVLSLRSCCRVAGRDAGERIALGPVPAALVLSCDGGLLSFIDAAPFVVLARASAMLAGVAFSGLDGFNGEIGRDR